MSSKLERDRIMVEVDYYEDMYGRRRDYLDTIKSLEFTSLIEWLTIQKADMIMDGYYNPRFHFSCGTMSHENGSIESFPNLTIRAKRLENDKEYEERIVEHIADAVDTKAKSFDKDYQEFLRLKNIFEP